MSKIIKGQVNVDMSVYTKFSKDMGFFSIHADVWSVVSEDINEGHSSVYVHEITEICEQFRINSEKVKRDGFEELYVKLYGDGAFARLLVDFYQEIENEYYKTTEYKPINIK